LEVAFNKINPRVTNPSEIIHEESPLEPKKEDNINEHGSYFMNTSSNPCSYEKSLELIGLSTTHEIFNPLILPVHKTLKRWLLMRLFIINIANLVVLLA
jgi:hypothetical protein